MGLDSEAVASLQIAAVDVLSQGRAQAGGPSNFLRQMAALDPSNTTSRLKVAELLKQEGLEQDAIVEYQAVAAELESQGDRDQLIVVMDRLLEIQPNHSRNPQRPGTEPDGCGRTSIAPNHWPVRGPRPLGPTRRNTNSRSISMLRWAMTKSWPTPRAA